MRTVLATCLSKLNRYISNTNRDFLIIAETTDHDGLLEILSVQKVDFLIVSDVLFRKVSFDVILESMEKIKELLGVGQLLYLGVKKPLNEQEAELLAARRIRVLNSPITAQEISGQLYRIIQDCSAGKAPQVITVWSPKAGDGASITTEALALGLCNVRVNEQLKIGVLDFNLKSPYLKYRFKLDGCLILDELKPFIGGGKLTAEVLTDYSQAVFGMEKLHFIGGMRRPELYNRYAYIQLNAILETARTYYDLILIDAGSLPDNAGTVTALRSGDLIMTVIQPSYVAKQCLKHSLSLFPALGINPHKVRLIINRYVSEIFDSPQVICAGLDVELTGTLPELGPIANLPTDDSLFASQSSKVVGAYNAELKQVMKKMELLNEKSPNPKTARFAKLLIRSG